MSRASLFVPLGVFVLLSCLLLASFQLDDPALLPSELIDRPVPEFSLPELHSGELLSRANLPGEPALLNVWASWCPGCLVEHPELLRIAGTEGVPVIGLNYGDEAAAARQWLQRHGNPYRFSLYDPDGRLAVDLGVYGAPETFVVDAGGVIRYRHLGVIDREVWRRQLQPLLRKFQAEAEAREGG